MSASYKQAYSLSLPLLRPLLPASCNVVISMYTYTVCLHATKQDCLSLEQLLMTTAVIIMVVKPKFSAHFITGRIIQC